MALSAAWLGALMLGGLACSKENADGTTTVELEELPGLEARLPAGTRVAKNAVGIGVMLKGTGVSMTISPFQDGDASTLAEGKTNAEAYGPTNLEGEDLSDGFILTYESAEKTGPTYWLVGRRTFGDASYSCGVRSPQKAHQQSAVAICKSLKR